MSKTHTPKKTKRFGDARDSADYNGSKSTMPPRTRSGAKYPGGKLLRRAFDKLGYRKDNHLYTQGDRKGRSLGVTPGSMKG